MTSFHQHRQRGELVYGAEKRRSWLQRLTEPMFYLANLFFMVAFYPVTATSKVRWTSAPDASSELLERCRRPIIYFSWHGYSWPSFIAFRRLPRALRPTGIAHDGPGSRLNARTGMWSGFDMLIFRRAAAASPKEQIIAYVERTRRPLMLFPDSGGPYRILKPGILAIARELDAVLVPFVVRVRPSIRLGATMRHLLPLPFGRVELIHASPIEAAEATAEGCEQALAALEATDDGAGPEG